MTLWRDLIDAPPPADRPAPGRADVAGAVVVGALVVLDVLVGEGRGWPGPNAGFGLVMAGAMVWRRRHPLAMFVLVFGAALGLDLVAWRGGVPWTAPPSHAQVLLFAYALFRWGSGRGVVVGAAVMALAFGLSAWSGQMRTAAEVVGGAVVMMFPGVVGATLRFRAQAQAQRLQEVRLRERERLARELHDTVAHHVSAIAIQAQAGQALAPEQPERAAAILGVIEQAASQTLAEMRAIVRALRDNENAQGLAAEGAALRPAPGLRDLRALAETGGGVVVQVDDDAHPVSPAVATALFRIAQESVTNARRHATGHSRIDVRLRGRGDDVELTVTDDGRGGPVAAGGFGRLGMAERAALLGGSVVAGPDPAGGFVVTARLPRTPRAREGD